MLSSMVDLFQGDIAGFEALKISKYGGMLFRGVRGFSATVVSSNVRSWVIGMCTGQVRSITSGLRWSPFSFIYILRL